MTKANDLFPFSIAAGFLILVGALAVWISGCEHGANIPIDAPALSCVDLVTDECVPEVIAEFCTSCEVCETCEVCTTCETCTICEVCPDPETVYLCEQRTKVCDPKCPWKCEYVTTWVECDGQPSTCDSYGNDVPRGHLPKECRGKAK